MSSIYIIEKGVPRPIRSRGHVVSPEWLTIERLEPGDSFLVPAGRYKAAMNAVSKAHRTTKIRLSSTQYEDGSARIWRDTEE